MKSRMSRQRGIGLFMEITEGLGVVIKENMAAVGSSSVEQRQEAIVRLLDANLKLTVQVRFSIGDLYNSIPDKRGERLRFVQENFPEKLVDRTYKNLRQYGWVANKWPPRDRLKDLPWQHYVNNTPGVIKEKESFHLMTERIKQRMKQVWAEAQYWKAIGSQMTFEEWYESAHLTPESRGIYVTTIDGESSTTIVHEEKESYLYPPQKGGGLPSVDYNGKEEYFEKKASEEREVQSDDMEQVKKGVEYLRRNIFLEE